MRKKFIIGILIVLIIVVISLSTLALFKWTSPNTTLTLEVGEMTDVIFQEGNDIIANNIGPVLNYEDGEITEFAIINNAENEQQAKFYLDISEISDSLKEESFKYLLQTSTDGNNYETYKEGNFASATTGELVISDSEVLPSGRTYYRFIIYIDGNMENPTSMMNNSLKVTFNVGTLNASDITLVKLGLTANEGTPNFANIATTDEGIYSAQDDYGTSYYFRGAVTNNYVKFAGFYWRIVRINGDGSIRLIYDGTSAHANGESSSDRSIGTSAFNYTYGDNAYVGYMMGIDNQCASESCKGTANTISCEQAYANTYDSTIKKTVDNWYKINIHDAGYSNKIADVIYCNDRSIYNGNGYGSSTTYYGGYDRLTTNKSPILTCTNQNDRFTVNDTTLGNGALTYPVGLITADEVAMGGGKHPTSNFNYYLYAGGYYWTMSPYFFNGFAYEFRVFTDPDFNNYYVHLAYNVRPVLSLKPSVELTGSGTMDDPWILS